MSIFELHLVVNHFPVVTAFLALISLAWSWVQRTGEFYRSGRRLLIYNGVFALLAYITGLIIEDSAEALRYLDHDSMELHAAIALAALIVSLLAAALAFVLPKAEEKNRYWLFFLSLITFITLATSAYFGGRIAHKELKQTISVEVHEDD